METFNSPTIEETNLTVWQMLSQHQSVRSLRDQVDSKVFAQITAAELLFNKKFTAMEREVLTELDLIPAELHAEDKQQFIENCAHAKILLCIVNKERYAPLIWQAIKPETTEG